VVIWDKFPYFFTPILTFPLGKGEGTGSPLSRQERGRGEGLLPAQQDNPEARLNPFTETAVLNKEGGKDCFFKKIRLEMLQ
jgi:hypothetical protein